MTVARLFTYWISTVLIGSVLAPLILSIIFGGDGSGILDIILISIVASMICSLPTILVFYLVLSFQIDRKIPEAQKNRTLMWIHLSCGFITFFILGALIQFETLSPIIAYFVVYTTIGMLFWYFEFKKQADKSVALKEENRTAEETKNSF